MTFEHPYRHRWVMWFTSCLLASMKIAEWAGNLSIECYWA